MLMQKPVMMLNRKREKQRFLLCHDLFNECTHQNSKTFLVHIALVHIAPVHIAMYDKSFFFTSNNRSHNFFIIKLLLAAKVGDRYFFNIKRLLVNHFMIFLNYNDQYNYNLLFYLPNTVKSIATTV